MTRGNAMTVETMVFILTILLALLHVLIDFLFNLKAHGLVALAGPRISSRNREVPSINAPSGPTTI